MRKYENCFSQKLGTVFGCRRKRSSETSSRIGKITGFEDTQQYMASQGMPMTAVLLVGAIVVEVLGGLSVVLGLWTRAGAAALVLFLVPATLIFHTDFGDQTQMIMFLKNLSIMGGLLFVTAYGSGEYSLRSLDEADVAYA